MASSVEPQLLSLLLQGETQTAVAANNTLQHSTVENTGEQPSPDRVPKGPLLAQTISVHALAATSRHGPLYPHFLQHMQHCAHAAIAFSEHYQSTVTLSCNAHCNRVLLYCSNPVLQCEWSAEIRKQKKGSSTSVLRMLDCVLEAWVPDGATLGEDETEAIRSVQTEPAGIVCKHQSKPQVSAVRGHSATPPRGPTVSAQHHMPGMWLMESVRRVGICSATAQHHSGTVGPHYNTLVVYCTVH